MSEPVKGFKVFNPDWTCMDKQYTCPGKFEEDVTPEVCDRGIHFCKRLDDCFDYYDFNSNNHVAEVIAYGDIAEEGNKCCTNKLEIVREMSWDEVIGAVNTGRDCIGDYIMDKNKLLTNTISYVLLLATCLSAWGLFITHRNFKTYQQEATQQLQQVNIELEQNKSTITTLRQELDSMGQIKEQYDTIKKSYDDLQTANKSLQDRYNELEANNKTLKTTYDELKKSYDELSKNYSTSQTNPNTLKQHTASTATAGAEQSSSQSSSYMVYKTKTGDKYHRSGCRYLSKSKIAISIEGARAMGLTACKVCKP